MVSQTRLGLVFSCVLFACASPSPKSVSPDAMEDRVQIEKLSNGLTLVMVEDHTTPVVTYQSWFRVGSIDEDLGKTGYAHLFEHLMFSGTPKYGPRQFFLELEARGAEVNAYTMRDYTCYHITSTPNLLPKIIEMESDRLQNLKISEEALETEKQVVFEEIRMRTENSPSGKMNEALWQLAYRRHPYQRPISGYLQDLAAATVEQVNGFLRKHYHPANLALVVIGDFDSRAVRRLIRDAYGDIDEGEVSSREFPKEPRQNAERRLTLRDHVAAPRFIQGYHVTSAFDFDSYALDVLANILFHGTRSRVYSRLVEEKAWATTVGGAAYTPTFPGMFMINAVIKPDVTISQVEKELFSVIRKVQKEGVTQDEVDAAVKQLKVQVYDGMRTFYGMGQLLGTVQMVLGNARLFRQDIKKYERVTVADVKRVAVKYLFPNNRTVVELLPKEKL